MNEGYIKLYRKFVTWEWYDDINTSRLFLHLLFTVNWQDKKWHGVDVKRGSVITSLSKLSDETGLTLDQVRGSLAKLISTNEITKQTTNRYTIISVVKYNDYQVNDKDNPKQNTTQLTKQAPNEPQTDPTQTPTTKEFKELKEDNNTSLKENKLNEINNQEEPTLFELFEDEFKRPLTQIEIKRLFDWQQEHDEQLVVYALREASINKKWSFNYIGQILYEWQRNGMTAEKYEERENDG
jgi:DnaD/phage-associated family protein